MSVGDLIAVVVWAALLLIGRSAWREQKREDGTGWKAPGS